MNDSSPFGAASASPRGGASFSSLVVGRREQLRVPKDVQERLTRAGGKNFYGGPNFRLTWGWEPIEYIYSLKNWRYELAPRYIAKPNRFYLEKWHSPDSYGTPRTWRYFHTQNVEGREVDLLGPFPTFGGYEQLSTLETPHKPICKTPRLEECPCGGGSYMSLTLSAVDALVGLVERAREVNPWERRNRALAEIESQGVEQEQLVDEVCREAVPAFGMEAHVVLNNWGAAKTVPRRNGVPE